MDLNRYVQLTRTHEANLTEKEVKDGWHFCCEWDGMLIHSSHPEAECCYCLREVGLNDAKEEK